MVKKYIYFITLFLILLSSSNVFAATNIFFDENDKSQILIGNVVNSINGQTGDVIISTGTSPNDFNLEPYKAEVAIATSTLQLNKVDKTGGELTGNLLSPNFRATYGIFAATATFTGNVKVSSITFQDGTVLCSTASFGGSSNSVLKTGDTMLGNLTVPNLIANYGIFASSANFYGMILATGTYGSGQDLTISGAGTRLIWYPKKSAFRAGQVSGTQWNDSNVGDWSFAGGFDPKLFGQYTFGFGSKPTVNGNYSGAAGNIVTVNGNVSFGFGANLLADAGASFLAGQYLTSQAYNETIFGRYNIISTYRTTWIDTDPLFIIGNGASDSNRSNALTVLKNGQTTINGTMTASQIKSTSNIEIEASSAVYLGDMNTNGSWRLIRSGNDAVMQRRESGVWVDKFAFTA